MGYASKLSALTQRVELASLPGYWVDVRILSKKQEDQCNSALIGSSKNHARWETEPGAKKGRTIVEQDLDQSVYTREKLFLGIVAWNLDGEGDQEGVVLPITRETVELLSGPDSTKLVEVIDSLSAPLDSSNSTTTPSASTT